MNAEAIKSGHYARQERAKSERNAVEERDESAGYVGEDWGDAENDGDEDDKEEEESAYHVKDEQRWKPDEGHSRFVL